MKTKPAYQLDANNYLTGETVADESPREPGVFLIPAGCVMVRPPPHVDGKRRRFLKGAWLYEDAPAPVEPPAPKPVARTIEQALYEKLKQINDACAYWLHQLKASTPMDEVLSWGRQEAEARAYLADSSVATPFLSALSQARGIALDVLAARVVEKADLYAVQSACLIGTRQRFEDQAHAAAKVENLTEENIIAAIDAVKWVTPQLPGKVQ